MNIHSLPADEALKSLVSSWKGLTGAEAGARLHEYGPNAIKEVRGRPFYLKVLAQFTHFLAVLLWVAAALCFLSGFLHPGEGMLPLGIAITAVIFINAAFTLVQEYRAGRAVDALKRLMPSNAKVVRDGTLVETPSADVAPGDIIVLSEGDKVPADSRLIESNRLSVNNAALTGESGPMPRSSGPFEGEFLESPNIVFAGTLVVAGTGRAVAFATGMSTEFGKIAHLTGAVEPGLTPLQKEIIKATRIVAVIAATTGIFFFSVGLLTGRGFWHNFLFAVGIIIANVPEGLLPTVTLSLAMGSQRMARKKALIKTLTSVETLGSVTYICTDKTGTLTQNKMVVRSVQAEDMDMLMTAAALCNNAVYDGEGYRGDPTETAVLKAARESLGDIGSRRVMEVPFDSERKRMTTVNEKEGRLLVLTKGAFESVLPLCKGIDKVMDDRLALSCRSMMDDGLRVIAFAYKVVPEDAGRLAAMDETLIEDRLTFAGLMGLEDPPRPGVAEAIEKCRGAGIKVVMMTGDASRTAAAIARRIGLSGGDPVVVEGPDLDAMPDSALREFLQKDGVIFSRVSPRHKMRVVSVLKDEGERVAVTGDGVNDAPALKKADIGIAMGLSGTDVAREAADMVLLDDNFATIVNAVEEGKAIFENIKKFITYIFAHLTPEAVPYILFALFTIPLPLTVMQILAIDLGTETIPALALGVEPPEKNIMKYPPQKGRALIDREVLIRGYLFFGLISAAGVLTAYFYVLYGGGWRWGTALPMGHPLARQAASATFLGIVLMQVGNVFACRSSRESVFGAGFFSNRLILVGIAAEVALAALIIYTGPGNSMFGTAPLGPGVWLILLPFPAGLLLLEEVRKYIRRKKA